MRPGLALLAQASTDPPTVVAPAATDVASTVFYATTILVVAVVLGIVAFGIRKRLLNSDEPDASVGMGFTLADLRQMHDAGEISDEEFTRAKSKMLAHARAGLDDETDDPADDGQVHLNADPDGPFNEDRSDDPDPPGPPTR